MFGFSGLAISRNVYLAVVLLHVQILSNSWGNFENTQSEEMTLKT